MSEIPILSCLVILPLIASLVILLVKNDDETILLNVKYIAIAVLLVEVILLIYAWILFDDIVFGYQLVERIVLVESINFSYVLGIDGISLVFITVFVLILFSIFVGVQIPKRYPKVYAVSLLSILSFSIATFLSLDIILFYVFYELSLIPVFFLINVFGEGDKGYAASKFILYTIFGSIFMLIAIAAIILLTGSSDVTDIYLFTFSLEQQKYLFIALFIAFAIKSALFPFHTWLPTVYASAPLFLNIVLSGILMKYGIYGFIRFIIPNFSSAVISYNFVLYMICLITMLYASFLAYYQDNLKKLFGYLSIAHVALIVAAVFSSTVQGIEGAVVQSVNHSIVNLGVFLSLIYINNRFNSRNLSDFSGIASVMPAFSVLFFIISLALIGFPVTNTFVGEVVMLLGLFHNNRIFATLFTFAILLNAIVVLRYIRIFLFGDVNAYTQIMNKLHYKEISILAGIVGIIILLGIYPMPVFNAIYGSVSDVLEYFASSILL